MKQDDTHLLQPHLTSVEHSVEKESDYKAEKHMKNLKQLIEKYQANEKIDKSVADNLINHVNSLIEKWNKNIKITFPYCVHNIDYEVMLFILLFNYYLYLIYMLVVNIYVF